MTRLPTCTLGFPLILFLESTLGGTSSALCGIFLYRVSPYLSGHVLDPAATSWSHWSPLSLVPSLVVVLTRRHPPLLADPFCTHASTGSATSLSFTSSNAIRGSGVHSHLLPFRSKSFRVFVPNRSRHTQNDGVAAMVTAMQDHRRCGNCAEAELA